MIAGPDAMPACDDYARTRPPSPVPMESSSHYVTMRDGTRLAVDVHRPAGHDRPLPVLVRQTRYFRALEPTLVGRVLGEARIDPVNGRMRRSFVARGYAWVDVDVRGSGASSGVWHSPWSPLEVADGAEVLDWIVAQPWCSGRIGTTGNSYDGTAAELLASNGHPALRACAPRCSLYDVYTDIAYPGGVRQAWFTEAWTRANQALDANHPEVMVAEAIAQGQPWLEAGVRRRVLEALLRTIFRRVRPVGGDHAAIARSLAVRAGNLDVHARAAEVEYRDDVQDSPIGPRTVDAFSPSAYLERQRAAGVPMLGISGWFDAAYPHAAIKRHLTLGGGPRQLVLGPWNHGAGIQASPHAPSRDVAYDLDAELLRFFDHHLLERDTGTASEAGVRYYVMGAEAWRRASAWPPPDVVPRRLYLGEQRTLGWAPPALAGRDTLAHDPARGSGRRSRWRTLVSPFVVPDYPDRAERDRRLLVYRSAPLDTELELAGHPLVELFAIPDAADGAVFAYLEEETAAGVHYVTEGQVRAIHRPSTEPPLFTTAAPYRSFLRRDARPLAPGELVRLVFDLLPVAYRFARGSRIRLAFATADADHFAAIPGAASWSVERGPVHASALELPVRGLC